MNIFNQQYFLYKYQIEVIKSEATEGLNEDVAKQVLEAIIKCFLEWQIAHGVKPVLRAAEFQSKTHPICQTRKRPPYRVGESANLTPH